MTIYNLGSANIDYVYKVDHFTAAGETLSSDGMQVFPGGKGLNQSVAIARAGSRVIHGSVIGEKGECLTQVLCDSGVDVSRIQTVNAPSGHAIIQVDKTGQNSILLYAGTNHLIDREYIARFLADAEPGDILLLQNEISGLDAAFEAAVGKGMSIAFNPSPYDDTLQKLPLHDVTWWFCNELEGAALFGGKSPSEIADRFLRKYPDGRLILTLGGDGCLYKSADRLIRQPAFPVEVVDTTAAGDTFTGYFLSAAAGGKDVADALKIASAGASLAVSAKGASASIPWLSAVQKRYPDLV